MPRIDPFLDVLLRDKADQLYLLPEEPVTVVKAGKPRKVSKQPLTASHIYALLVEVAPEEAVKYIDEMGETEFDYDAPRGTVRVRIVPENGRLTAVIAPAPSGAPAPAAPGEPFETPTPRPPRPSVIAAAPMVKRPVEAPPPPSPTPPPSPVMAAPAPAAPVARPVERAAREPAAAEPRLAALLRELVRSGASDLHLRAGESPVFRTHGELERREAAAFTAEELERLLLSLMPERNRARWKETGDTDFAHEVAGLARFRVNAARDRKGPVAVFRAIPVHGVTVEELGLPKEVQQLSALAKGLVLVTGPTGSGTSTTLYALIDLINRTRSVHIITIEEPIEFAHENKQSLVTQREVKLHTDSFAAALRAALREDPDVVLVGAMPDLDTIAAAIETADAGHLVFGTLPTTTATATVDRIIERFPPDRRAELRLILSETLKGVVAQTLCKKTGGGRVAAREILLATPALANLIKEGKTGQIPSVIQTGRKLGMTSLNDSLLELVEQGEVAPEEAYAKAVDKVGLAGHFKAKGIAFTAATE